MCVKKINLGIVAHVDAGKTTLSEALCYHCGAISSLGRVDHASSLLDYNELERKRKITISNKQVSMNYEDVSITLLDTPGHIDFSPQMESILQVIDVAVVVINAMDGIQQHTKTISRLLNHYAIPTIIFFNKMDCTNYTKDELIKNGTTVFNQEIVDFNQDSMAIFEQIAMTNEVLLNEFIENNTLSDSSMYHAFYSHSFIPCFFGSALLNEGVQTLLNGLKMFSKDAMLVNENKVTVYKITHDHNEQRLTHVLINEGSLKVRDALNNEKITQIRRYVANKYEVVQVANQGDICVLVGLQNTYHGQVIGCVDTPSIKPYLKSCLQYQVEVAEGVDLFIVFECFKKLEQEDPTLVVEYKQENKVLYVQAMGEVHLEVLQYVLKHRFGIEVQFSSGNVIYLETIIDESIGFGHFEPLKHYAEIHIGIKPLPRGSGIVVENKYTGEECSTQYIKQVVKYLETNPIRGIGINAKLTDICFTILNAKSHEKHTSSGDFIEATQRAVRYALIKANFAVLEPFIKSSINIPNSYVSALIYEIERREGSYVFVEQGVDSVCIKLEAPVRLMHAFEMVLSHLTQGDMTYAIDEIIYKVSMNQSLIVEEVNYRYSEDPNISANSIFCSKGSGYSVEYKDVKKKMHLDTNYKKIRNYEDEVYVVEDYMEIFERTYGKVERKKFDSIKKKKEPAMEYKHLPLCVIIDGYNLLHEYYKHQNLTYVDFDDARNQLIHVLANYQGYRDCLVLVVFDGHKVKGNIGSHEISNQLHIIYTKEAQTADMYIESITGDLTKEYLVTVVTSDNLQQIIVLSKGAIRQSSREFLLHYEALKKDTIQQYLDKQVKHPDFSK